MRVAYAFSAANIAYSSGVSPLPSSFERPFLSKCHPMCTCVSIAPGINVRSPRSMSAREGWGSMRTIFEPSTTTAALRMTCPRPSRMRDAEMTRASRTADMRPSLCSPLQWRKAMRKPTLLYLATVLVLFGCSTYTPMSSSSVLGGTPVSDSDIAAIVTAANQGEIDQANAALTKASSSAVRDFAQMMITDHTNALSAAQSLFSNRNSTPTDNSTSNSLKSGSQQMISALNTYRGAAV